MAMQTKKAFYLLTGLILVPPCLFFSYYTARLLYVNLVMDDAAAHRTGGMLIGVIAFPVAAIISGLISWFCLKRALSVTPKQ
jgi:hypothetical protein